MRIRSIGARLAIPAVAIGLIVSGCSSDSTQTAPSDIGSTNDINPRDPSELRDGGNLRTDLTALPQNFNYLNVDGTDENTSSVIDPVMPSAFTADAAGNIGINHDYFTDIQLTGTDPQKVTYTINPQAVWSDGTPITWEDLKSEAHALSGADPGYLLSSPSGFDKVASVERGVDDRQAVLTFSKPYAEWKGQFSPLYPKSVTQTPQAFNESIRSNLPVSAGPFVITNIDRTQNRITLGRNPKWWGAPPKLDTVTFSVLDPTAVLAAIQNNEIDYAYLSGRTNVVAAHSIPDITVRTAPESRWNVLTFNGAPGAVMSDAKVRVAISKAIDRQAIADALQNGIVTNPRPLNNHIFLSGQKGYQDNSAPSAFDPAAAAAELDALGWKLNGDVREKDGRKLVLKDVMYQQDAWVDVAKIIQENLQKIGVKLEIQTVPGQGLFTDVINPGNYDLAEHGWGGSVFPLGALEQIYYYDPNNPQSNSGRIGSPELNALIQKTISELDPEKAIDMANQADKMIWEEGFSLPLVQASGNYGVRSTLANVGAFGLATVDWTKVGYLK
ncbi:peptide/nickel transport system substrate-binding protein [Nocardia transvalensis]|uniref:Peptide/nickel transport system substrate-binding protein n=1 Tax=Nocardia transvalensis TaxID=37333 RepID=A0A7W9PCK7_9NOCA|nr:ABC transporter family substrate-binding protein [Nocardia transvalensis]MBB5913676.1 peptide/nickel transport system substrate-binding protein [Nocardia transvalensis]